MSPKPIDPAEGPDGVAAPFDESVTISRAELEELRALAQAGRATRGREAEAASDREEALTREISSRDRRVADLESACRKAVRERELATALAGKPLVPGAAGQLVTLWRDDFDVYEESGEYKLAARDGRTVAQWVDDRLGGPEFAHFRLPSSRGGAGPRGASQSGPIETAPQARTLGEAVIARWRDEGSRRSGPAGLPGGWGRPR